MKKYAIQIGLVLLAFAVLAGAAYLGPLIMRVFPNASYRFVLFFLLIILISNILAKIAYKYFEI